MSDATTLPSASLFRRLAALFYDSLLLLAVLFVATALALPFSGGAALRPHNPFYSTYLLIVCFLFFAWFWMHGGQTLGMRTWRLRLQRTDGKPLTLWHIVLRFFCAIPSWGFFGIGFWWMLFNKRKLTWHDQFSETRIVQLEKNPGA